VPETEMYRAFNMGIGMALIVDAAAAETVCERLRAAGETVYRVGAIVPGPRSVIWTDEGR
jgi:phosphoribosylformylglycinamidine cyclo-ligase